MSANHIGGDASTAIPGVQKRILLGHLGSFGDCLYTTAIARQIKHDLPASHLTWAIGSMYRSVIDLNPHVDEVWEIPVSGVGEAIHVWPEFERQVAARKARGDFELVYLTQSLPSNIRNYDGTIRSSIFRNYPGRITVPVTPVVRLSESEVERVRVFAEAHRLRERQGVILFECVPRSGQSAATLEFALGIAHSLVRSVDNVSVILSSHVTFHSDNDRIIDGSVLSFRENAELSKYCTLLVGSSSGVTWLCTSDWAKPLPMIQMIKPDAFCFASVVYDHQYFGLPYDSIIELRDDEPGRLLPCVLKVIAGDFTGARREFHREMRMSYRHYENTQRTYLQHGRLVEAVRFFYFHVRRHGFRLRFLFWPFYRLFKKLRAFRET